MSAGSAAADTTGEMGALGVVDIAQATEQSSTGFPGKALTLHQPWASLIAIGAKTIETRSWATSYRGSLAIHAGRAKPDVPTFKRLTALACPDAKLCAWMLADDYQMIQRGRERQIAERGYAWSQPQSEDHPEFPLGAIVATCELIDVAPIGGPEWFRIGVAEGDEGNFPGRAVVVHHPHSGPAVPEALILDADGRQTVISDQLPYGDYTPGRFAWLLAGIKPLPAPVPAKGRQGL